MRDYNGFSGLQRSRAQSWLNAQWRNDALRRPSVCCACGQDHGVIDAHAEDYSEPFQAGKTDEFPLCFVCHMMVHCRFRNETAWLRYVGAVEAGARFMAFTSRNFPKFRGLFLDGDLARAPYALHEPRRDNPLRRIDPSLPAEIAHWADASRFAIGAGHQLHLGVD